jgi:hypothetical protein
MRPLWEASPDAYKALATIWRPERALRAGLACFELHREPNGDVRVVPVLTADGPEPLSDQNHRNRRAQSRM